MTTRKITAKIGTKVEYKIIKDGFDTVSNNIVLNENTPKQIHLAPSQEVYNSDIQYELDQTKPCSPIIDIVEDFHLPDDTVFPAEKCILAPLNQTYRIPGETEAPSTYNNNFSLIGNVRQFYNILENFSTSNYVVLQNVFDSSLPWTVVFKFNLDTIDDTAKVLLGYNSSGLFKLAIYNKKLEFGVSTSTSDWNIGQIVGTQVFQTYKDYWIKVEFTGSAYNAYVSEDGLTYNLEGTIESSEAFVVPNQFVIGNGGWQFNEVFTGSIDLNETYIQVNRKMWWKPEYKNIIGWYSTVGSRGVISGGIARNFSSDNCLKLNKTFPSDSTDWEIKFKIRTGSDTYTNQIFFSCFGDIYCPVALNVVYDRFAIYLTNSSNSWSIAQNLSGNHVVQKNYDYYVKMVYKNNVYTLSYSYDDNVYTDDIILESTQKIASFTPNIGCWKKTSSGDGIFMGSIDLKESYIKINDELLWDGTEYETIGYWNDEGIIKGFSLSNHMVMSYPFQPSSKPWEMVFKIKTKEDVTTYGSLTGANGNTFKHVFISITDSKINVDLGSNGTSWDIGSISGGSILPNTDYLIKTEYTGNAYNLYYKTLDSEYELIGTIESSTPIYQNELTQTIGINKWTSSSGDSPFLGYVDLNECYIKIDDKLWWQGISKNKFKKCNFKMIGNPNINMNGIVSNFSNSNYIQFPYVVNNETEIFTRFTTGSDISNIPNLISIFNSSNQNGGEIYIINNKFQTYNIASTVDVPLVSAEPNTTYQVRMKLNPSGRTITIYDDEGNVLKEHTENDSGATFTNTSIINFGFLNSDDTSRYWKGSIDLANTYVITDGIMYKMLNLFGEYLYGILDPSFIDEYTQEQLAKLYCVTLPNSQYLCLTKENVNDEKAIYKQYITDITIPARDVIYRYDDNTETWTSNTQDESDREPNSGEEEIEPANNIKYYAFDPDDNSFLTTANTNGGFNCNTDIFFSTSAEIGTHEVLYMLNPETDNMVAITNVEVNISADSIKVYPKGPHFFSAPVQANAIRYEAGDILANETPEASTTATLSNSNVSIT